MELGKQIEQEFGLRQVEYEFLTSPTNDVVAVTTPSDRYALKIYNRNSRGVADVRWEVDLILHLLADGVPVVRPIGRANEFVKTLRVADEDRASVLFEWLPGTKPKAGSETYVRLGEAAARIHRAGDSFRSQFARDPYDEFVLIDEQLHRMRSHLVRAGKLSAMEHIAERMKQVLAACTLDWGICHMDLTLDNVHENDGQLVVFDFDSSGECWRALEPHGVLLSSEAYFAKWLEGYRSVRTFSPEDQRAVSAFCIIGELRNVAWKLGVAASSRGKPLINIDDLIVTVDGWLALVDDGYSGPMMPTSTPPAG